MPGSQNCSLNSLRNPSRNVLRVFDVCSEIQYDSKSYFGFVEDNFFEIVHTESATRNSCVITLLVAVSSRCPAVKELGEFLRIILLQIRNNFYNRFALLNKHQILSMRFDENLCGNSAHNFDCRAFNLFDKSSQVKSCQFLFKLTQKLY